MQLFPTTVKGQSYYIFAILVMVLILFTQSYGMYDWNKWFRKTNSEAA